MLCAWGTFADSRESSGKRIAAWETHGLYIFMGVYVVAMRLASFKQAEWELTTDHLVLCKGHSTDYTNKYGHFHRISPVCTVLTGPNLVQFDSREGGSLK